MNANAIYSKSGKGVQEASGKTSNLARPDRAVLSAIDGRATLADVAQKVGKTFDPTFEKLIEKLDKDGYVREVSPGTAPAAPAKPGAKPGAKPADIGSDLDFTAALSAPKGKAVPPPQAPPRATPAPAKHTATIPPPPPPPTAAEKAQAAKSAKEQQDAMAKAREEAERKAAEDKERAKAEAEARMRSENDAKARAEAEKKVAAEAEAKIKVARDAAAKAAADAKAAEDTARREREELNRKLEQERKAREEAERKAKEEAKRLEEERRKLDEERKRREEERKREEEERAARRKREEEEEQERKRKKKEEEEAEERRKAAERAERKKREEEEEARERAEKEAKRKAKKQQEEEEEARERAEKEARRKAKEQEKEKEKEQEQEQAAIDLPELDMTPKAPPKAKAPEPTPAKTGGGISDSLLADLESFTTREDDERKEKEEAERKAKEEAARRAREAEERRAKEEAERREREEKEQRKREEQERKERARAEEREREDKEKQRIRDEEEKRKKEAEEREKKAKQDEQLTAKATSSRAYDSEAAQRSRRDRMLGPKQATPAAAAARAEKKGGLGTTIGLGVVGLLVVAAVVANFMPLGTADYERAASEALGQTVKIGSARLSVFSGLQIKFSGVSIGDDVKIAEVRATPGIGALTGPKKDFSRIEIDGARIDQRAVGDALFVKVKGDSFSVERIVLRQIEFSGPLELPKGLDLELNYDRQGAVQSALVRGPEALVAKLAPRDSAIDVDLSASSFTLPFAPEISLARFSLKGAATRKGLAVSEWDGAIFNGTLSGTANVNWGDNWSVDGVVRASNINAAVFAPALLSEGRGEGSGKFTMRGQPGKLAQGARLDGSFIVSRGVLGTIDLSRAIQTGGKQGTGRTQFNEMNGQATYDRGAVSLRNVTISAGQLNAGASAEIAQSGALSGRIIADVKVASQTQRATLSLSGSVKEPQVRN